MQKRVLEIFSIAAAALAVSVTLATSLIAQTSQGPTSGQAQFLKKFLQTYLGKPYPAFEREAPTQYSSAFVDLNGDGKKEIIVYVSGRAWCGTGGCTMLIVAPEGESYKVVTKTPAVRLPIRVLATKSNGWHDIGVVGRKNGIEPLYEAILSFDGESYPSSVSEAGESELNGTVRGKIVMPVTAKDQPLYP